MADKVQGHLSAIERKLGKANNIAAKGEGIKYKDAIKLGTKSNSIVSTIKKIIREYENYYPTDDEAKKILEQMKTIVDLSEQQLTHLVSSKDHLSSLHVGGLVKKNVAKSRDAGKDLSDRMIAKAPADIKGDAEALEKRRLTAFEKATRAFEGQTGGEDAAEGEDDSD